MKAITSAALVAILGLAALPTVAMANDSVHGRDTNAVESALRHSGYNVSDLEEWSTYIRGWVVDANGHTTMQLFDKDTLQPVR